VTDARLRAAALAFVALGVAISGYLVWVRYAGTELICSTGGCEAVQSSRYAEVLGVPVALLGLVGYVLVGAIALSADPRALAAAAALALSAVAFSAYLLVVQLAVIGQTCDWCLANDVVASLVASALLLRLRGLPHAERTFDNGAARHTVAIGGRKR
jgi:uncharacterized membrane protein